MNLGIFCVKLILIKNEYERYQIIDFILGLEKVLFQMFYRKFSDVAVIN